MFPFDRSRRLLRSWEFKRFFSQKKVFRFVGCTVYRIPNDKGHFRLGITFKARGKSVDRNRTKRVIREFFRVNSTTLGPFDYNVVLYGLDQTRKIEFPYWLGLSSQFLRLTNPTSL